MMSLDEGERVFHLALAADWLQAKRDGHYRISTLGRSLAEEGFVHASRAHQVRGVHDTFYEGVTEPMVLLEIDPALLASPVVLEVPDGADEAFPHIYGPVDIGAVVAAPSWEEYAGE